MKLQKNKEKTRRLQITVRVVTLKITSYKTVRPYGKRKKKKRFKILYFMGKTNNLWEGCLQALHKFWSKIGLYGSL
jgi:hypothetical protein